MADYVLSAKGTYDGSNFDKGIKSSSSALDSLTEKAASVGSKVAKAAAAAGAAVAASAAALTKSSLGSYASYEQLVGGIDTLFKDSSSELQAYAANAYKTAGMSANQYMDTATSFSASLLQSLGNDTAKAVQYADMAITDMSDNANKMGTDMQLIQYAYQGFAKQNYTMLDNLKLGYGGTKSEMERLLADAEKIKAAHGEMADYSIDSFADIVDAIHVVQTEMGITGTTALEAADTIEGSVNSAKASWSNWLTSLANENADLDQSTRELVDSIVVAAGNIVPRIGQIAMSLGTVLKEQVPKYVKEAFDASPISDFVADAQARLNGFAAIWRAGSNPIESFRLVFANLKNTLSDLGVFDAVRSASERCFNALPGPAQSAVSSITSAFSGIKSAVMPVIEGIAEGARGFASSFSEAFSSGGGSIATLVSMSSAIMSLASPIGIAKTLFSEFGDEIASIGQSIGSSIVPMLSEIGSAIGSTVAAALPAVMTFVDVVIGNFQAMASVISQIMQQLAPILSELVTTGLSAISAVMPGVQAALAALGPVVQQVIDTVSDLASSVLPVVANLLTQISPIIVQIAGFISQLLSTLSPLIAQLASALLPVITQIVQAAMNLANAVIPIIVSALNVVMSAVQAIMPIIQAVLSVVVSAISIVVSAIGTLVTVVTNIASVVASVVSVVTACVSQVASFVFGIFAAIAEAISVAVSTAATFVSDCFSTIHGIIQSVCNACGAIVSSVFTAIANVFNSVTTTIQSAVNTAFNAASNAFSNMLSAISNTCGSILGAVQDGFSSAIGYITGLASQAWQWGADIINGIISGIQSCIGGIADAASGIAGTISSFLHFSEPDVGPLSNFHTFMPDMIDLMVSGITGGIGRLEKASELAAGAIGTSIDGALGDGYAIAGNVSLSVAAPSKRDRDEGQWPSFDEMVDAFSEAIEGANITAKTYLDKKLVSKELAGVMASCIAKNGRTRGGIA